MNLHQVELFMAVAEAGSVTRGAETAAISQPAVSRALAELERSVGARLFDRGPKGVVLTEAGRTLLEYGRRIFALEREAGEALADLRGLAAGRLAIGASTTVGDYLLPNALAAFLKGHPGVELTMEVANTEAIQEGVYSGRFDVGFTEGEVDRERFAVRILAEDELVVFAAPGHPLAGHSEATIPQLAQHPFVMREAGSGTRTVVEESFRGAGLAPTVAASLGSTAAIKRAVAAGLGLGVASALALREELDRGDLVRLRTPLHLRRQFHTVRLGWRRESAALRELLHLLASAQS